MRFATQTDFAVSRFGEEKGIQLLADAGFENLDYSMFIYENNEAPFTLPDDEFTAFFQKIAALIHSKGMTVDQTHPPFPTYIGDSEDDEQRLVIQKKAIKATALLGARYAIVHPAMVAMRRYDAYKSEMKEINMKRYMDLAPTLEEYGVVCCIENMFARDSHTKIICPTTCTTAEEMADYIDTLNNLCGAPLFAACLDTGHASIIHYDGYETVNPVSMIRILGDRLKALHVQDTDGIGDDHMPPGLGKNDWDSICKALKDVGYDGIFTLEADRLCIRCGSDCALESERLLYATAKAVVDRNWP